MLNRIAPDQRHRFHFFNTFFYTRWRTCKQKDARYKTVRQKISVCQSTNAVFDLQVQKWAKGDLFSKDFILVPINEQLHWSLAIICYPRNIGKFSESQLASWS